MRILQQW